MSYERAVHELNIYRKFKSNQLDEVPYDKRNHFASKNAISEREVVADAVMENCIPILLVSLAWSLYWGMHLPVIFTSNVVLYLNPDDKKNK